MNELVEQTYSFCADYNNKLSLLANLSALIKEHMPDTNWVGFYIYKKDKLYLGPFQGKVACTEIPVGKGVCGTSFEKKMLLNVRNVHEFPGHIACDSASNSELVIPLFYEGKGYGVLDIDSTSFDRFTSHDEEILEQTCRIISKALAKK